MTDKGIINRDLARTSREIIAFKQYANGKYGPRDNWPGNEIAKYEIMKANAARLRDELGAAA